MAESLGLTADDLLTTTRAVRKRLDLTRPVERSVIEECLEIAMQAPSGSNRQTWQWVPVDDPETKRQLADIYGEVFDEYSSSSSSSKAPASASYSGDSRAERVDRINASARYLRDHLHEVPAMLVVYQAGRPEQMPVASQPGWWGSIVPATWSFMLALRARGLGSVWTTMTCRREPEVAAVLGVDSEQFRQIGLFPVAYTIGTDFTRAPRNDTSAVIHWNQW